MASESIAGSYRFWTADSVFISAVLVHKLPEYSISESYFFTFVAVFAIHCIVYLTYSVAIYPRFLSPLRYLPGPQDNDWFIGQWRTLIKEPTGIPMRRWVNEIPNDGLIRYLHLFNNERVLVASPKALSEVLVTKSYNFVKPRMVREGISRILGLGILFAEGDEHKTQRKNLSPAFNFRHVKELYPIFWNKSKEMIAKIEAEIAEKKSNKIETSEWVSRATLDIIGLAGMGQDFNSLADPNTELNKVYRQIFSPNRSAQILGLLQFFLPGWFLRALPVKHNSSIGAASKVARDTSRQLIRQKKDLLQKSKTGLHSPDIISVALESGAFTDESLVDNMMTFLAAGHETTASAFTWAVYMLTRHPKIQHRLRDEIRTHIPNAEASITYNIIDNMPYLHAFCQEILRFYAPVPLTLRDTLVDTEICGVTIPKGTKVFLVPWAINFSQALWGDDVDEFNPDRWMKQGQANSGGAESNYAFMTFLHGPRSCIGSKFASAELECLIAAFVGRFEFTREAEKDGKDILIRGGITARPRDGMTVDINVVDGW